MRDVFPAFEFTDSHKPSFSRTPLQRISMKNGNAVQCDDWRDDSDAGGRRCVFDHCFNLEGLKTI